MIQAKSPSFYSGLTDASLHLLTSGLGLYSEDIEDFI